MCQFVVNFWSVLQSVPPGLGVMSAARGRGREEKEEENDEAMKAEKAMKTEEKDLPNSVAAAMEEDSLQ